MNHPKSWDINMAAATRTGNLTTAQKFFNAFRSWYIYASGYRQMGLRADDLRNEEDKDVATAITRLPDAENYERIFRVRRALDLSLKHQILPKEEWTKPEEDTYYMDPYVEAAKRERKEREHWDRI